jgi:F-type H+-transporting ATPase subunit delta
MGSATRVALENATARLSSLGDKVDLATGEELFAAGRIIGDSIQLRSALADPAADGAPKAALVRRLFDAYEPQTVEILVAIAASRWSNHTDLLAAIEEIGIRAIASSAPSSARVDEELFEFSAVVSSDAQLELALGSKLGSVDQKRALVERLLTNRSSEQTLAIVRQLVTQPRGRRIGELLRYASQVVADQSGAGIAVITTAKPLAATQLERLSTILQSQYGRPIRVNEVIDPSVIGGVRIKVGDDVIDGSVSARINDLRLQLAG